MVVSQLKKKLLAGEEGRITPLLVFSTTVAAFGGLLFGYDHGISGGLTSTESFLIEFFPGVYARMKEEEGRISNYCKFDSQLLTLFTSSLYLAGLFICPIVSHVTNKLGRRASMCAGGAFFFAGAASGGVALNVHMLIFSRFLMGVGLGFTNQSVPLYISEMAPARHRGAIFNLFDICVSAGILVANLVNYFTQKIDGGWGWRISIALPALPASILAAGAIFIPETPPSIIQRGGDLQEASCVLQRIRGCAEVSEELNHIVAAAETARAAAAAEGSRFFCRSPVRRNCRPYFVMALAFPVFQQLTGINLVNFYAPAMFRTMGLKESASLMSTMVTRIVGTVCCLAAMVMVDRLGRRPLFYVGGLQMFLSQVIVGGIMAAELGDSGTMAKECTNLMLAFLCFYVSGFGFSWGHLPRLVTSEIFPLEMRSKGQSIVVAAGFFFSSVMAESLLSMLCFMKWGIFFFFGGWVLLMTLFVFLFLPETKGIPLEEMRRVWDEHWYWKRFVDDEEEEREVNSSR